MDFSSQPQAASLPAAPAVPASSSTAAPASSNSYVLSWPQPTDGGHAPLQPNQFSSATTFLFCCCYCRFCHQHCLPLPHSPSHLSQVNKHQLSILANADEAVSPRSRSFRLCWWFKLLSLSTCSYCWWYLSSGKSVLSSVETTGPTHSKCFGFFSIRGSSPSCCWLPNFKFCLAPTWASSSFHIQFAYYATSWLPLSSSTRWWVDNSVYAKS